MAERNNTSFGSPLLWSGPGWAGRLCTSTYLFGSAASELTRRTRLVEPRAPALLAVVPVARGRCSGEGKAFSRGCAGKHRCAAMASCRPPSDVDRRAADSEGVGRLDRGVEQLLDGWTVGHVGSFWIDGLSTPQGPSWRCPRTCWSGSVVRAFHRNAPPDPSHRAFMSPRLTTVAGRIAV